MRSTARDWQTRVRLWAALVMAFYTVASMLFYSLGLIGAEVMESYSDLIQVVWDTYPVFYVAIAVHVALGLWKLFWRNTLKMPLWEAAQIGLGLCLPFFLLPHLMVTTALKYVFGSEENYVDLVLLTFPTVAWRYVVVALIIAAHAHIGAHVVLRMRPWYPRIRWLLVVVLLIIPLSAAGGYLRGGTDLYAQLQDGVMSHNDLPHPPPAAQEHWLRDFDTANTVAFLTLYALLFAGRELRLRLRARHSRLEVRYRSGAVVRVAPHTTLLEASRLGGVPLASICGGRGRCTTCRVRVDTGADHLSRMGQREAFALRQIGAPAGVRLACQAECLEGPISLSPLVDPATPSSVARGETPDSVGREVRVAVLVVQIEGFDTATEERLPYDTVSTLNLYFADLGRAVTEQGGTIDKFLGDGLVAYFGVDQDERRACRSALLALLVMAERLQLPPPLRIVAGLHFGPVLLGSVGFQERQELTIRGETVTTADRLQRLNAKLGSQLVVSTQVAASGGFDLSFLKVGRALLKSSSQGPAETVRVYIVQNLAEELPAGQVSGVEPGVRS